jgi:hypothetical protein
VTKGIEVLLAETGQQLRQGQASLLPQPLIPVDLSALGSPRFVVTIDTEEEFDWSAPFTRDQHGTTHVSHILSFQNLCDRHGVKPSYLCDYPISQDADAIELLGGFARDGRAEIGVQLHPWVNPPFDDVISTHNSFACNLSPELERKKLTALHDAIIKNIGVQPDIYRAGRYGAGDATTEILADLGIAIDSSVRARFDYSAENGPNYAQHPVDPYWLIPGQLMELPLTTVFSGALRGSGDTLFGRWFHSHTARSMFARSHILERIALTPEGIPVDKAKEGIDLALADGIAVLNLSFHSPSLMAGNTPYVRSEAELNEFYNWWEQVFNHLSQCGVRAATMAEIKSASHFYANS